MLLRASRDAARAARSAASRCAAAAAASSRSGPAGATAPNRLLRRPPIASPPIGTRGLSSHGGDSPVAAPPRSNRPGPPPGRVEFVADDKDLESDEALWVLYERWCKAFGEERDHDEMLRRFGCFKRFVRVVDRANREAIRDGRSCRNGINMYADGKLRELQACELFVTDLERLPYSDSRVIGRAGNVLFEDEDPKEEDFLDPFA